MIYHIEFASRGCGKTTRLIQVIKDYLQIHPEENVILITKSYVISRVYLANLKEFKDRIKCAVDPTDNNLRGVRGRRFFDEFVSNHTLMKPEFRGQEGDYYCSSLPKGEQEIDVMVKILSLYE